MTAPPPQDTAVILAGHGDRGGDDRNVTIERHRAVLEQKKRFASVSIALLKGERELEDSIAAVTGEKPAAIVVYPYFMADGYFVNRVLKHRISAMKLGLTPLFAPPLGLDPRLPELVSSTALKVAANQSCPVAEARLLIVGHGSKISRASAAATQSVADAIKDGSGFQSVETAYLEEAPFFSDRLTASRIPTIVSGFFSSGGMHGAEDVASAISDAGVNDTATYAGPIGAEPAIADIMLAAILERLKSSEKQT